MGKILPNINPTKTKAWQKLSQKVAAAKAINLQNSFSKEPARAQNMSLLFGDFFLDYSKNLVDAETLTFLLELADECGLAKARESLFGGMPINETEDRAVLHMALRAGSTSTFSVNGNPVQKDVSEVLQRMKTFSEEIIGGKRTGYTGKQFTDVVNIGIGGSDLGPLMVCRALSAYNETGIRVHFVSNVDQSHLIETLTRLDPETTLFIVASKTFTTLETLANARAARTWLTEELCTTYCVAKHFVALSTNLKEVQKFGITEEQTFGFWDWVGGRYSLWSSIGLSIALCIGYDRFEEMLEGAKSMDEHFLQAPHAENMPVILALLGIWYTNFLDAHTHAVLPYDQYLDRMPAYLQQAEMESNGKCTDRSGNRVNYATGPVIWGEPGTNGQHAFFQLIHQGTQLIPCDFIAFANPVHKNDTQHHLLLANFFAQSEALMRGKSAEEVKKELQQLLPDEAAINALLPYKTFEGNKPSNSLLIEKLTPRSLGKLIALYEHKIFVQGIIWNIYSFDQWGVELGKQLANKIIPELLGEIDEHAHDSSTLSLMHTYKKYINQTSLNND